MTDPKKWMFTFMEGVENAGSNSVAGTGSADLAINNTPLWLTVDFLEKKTLTGIQTRHWASSYAPTKIELFTSEDNTNWTSIGEFKTSGSTQTINHVNKGIPNAPPNFCPLSNNPATVARSLFRNLCTF